MALETLNPPIPWRPKPSPAVEARAALHLPQLRRSAREPTTLAIGTRIYAGRSGFGGAEDGGFATGRKAVRKNVDLATLGNLCVDVVLSVPTLPPGAKLERRAYMERLAAAPPDKKFWEAGGNCNLTIAAARLGLSCFTIGHVGDEIYGNFLLDVLMDENISYVGLSKNAVDAARVAAYETLVCWVLVDPFQKHGFCSVADFSDEPAFNWMTELTEEVKTAIRRSKILFCNGYAFDEFFPDLIISSIDFAIHAGTSVFFDPGPRIRKLLYGTLEEKKALELFLQQSDVLLFTSEEVESLTGIDNPIKAGQELLRRGVRTKWIVIKMGSKGSILIDRSTVSCAPAFKVDVVDTVGCGDSFTAAVAFGFLHGMSAVNTLGLANAVGAATATGCGAGRNVARLNKVLQLLVQSDLNEDDKFWNQLIGENHLADEVLLLSDMSINGRSDRLVRVPISDALFGLLPKFEINRMKHDQILTGNFLHKYFSEGNC